MERVDIMPQNQGNRPENTHTNNGNTGGDNREFGPQVRDPFDNVGDVDTEPDAMDPTVDEPVMTSGNTTPRPPEFERSPITLNNNERLNYRLSNGELLDTRDMIDAADRITEDLRSRTENLRPGMNRRL